MCSQVIWLNPDYAPRLLWDTSMGQDSSKGAEVRDVMAKAFKVGNARLTGSTTVPNTRYYSCGLTSNGVANRVMDLESGAEFG